MPKPVTPTLHNSVSFCNPLLVGSAAITSTSHFQPVNVHKVTSLNPSSLLISTLRLRAEIPQIHMNQSSLPVEPKHTQTSDPIQFSSTPKTPIPTSSPTPATISSNTEAPTQAPTQASTSTSVLHATEEAPAEDHSSLAVHQSKH